jgi:hypothetical protein
MIFTVSMRAGQQIAVPEPRGLRRVSSLGAVTGLDGDGSTSSNTAAGRPAGDEPESMAPPADPWLTEAPTSVVGDPATMREFSVPPPPDTMPYTHPAFAVKQSARRRRHAKPVLIVTLAGCALLIAVPLVIDRFQDDGPGRRAVGPVATTAPASRQPETAKTAAAGETATAGPAPSVQAPAPEVVYEVTASGSGNTGSISYTDEDGQIIRRNGVPLPWRTTFRAGTQWQPLVLDAQRKNGGDAGPVTCTITVGGKVLASTTAEGRYASALCSGSG